ncbi:MAG: hypothetical protein AAF709_14790 [Pseudomonadota bacterium]
MMRKKVDRRDSLKARRGTSPYSDPVAELVGFGFRGWLYGIQHVDVLAWETVWRRYAGLLGTVQARVIVSELETWTRCVDRTACRKLDLECMSCPRLSTDERLATSIVAAAQHQSCPAMRACAFALMDTSEIDPMLDRAEQFARALMSADQVLPYWAIDSGLRPHTSSNCKNTVH